ncbi:hypothetical protein [[Actinomadura] parvosata]|nr:hypothetical protein [Nonomuraea sp. ATCC 55076]
MSARVIERLTGRVRVLPAIVVTEWWCDAHAAARRFPAWNS